MMLLISLHDASIGHPVIGDKENVVTVPDEPRVVDHRAARGHGPRGREPERAPAELHELRHRLRHEHQIPRAATPLGAEMVTRTRVVLSLSSRRLVPPPSCRFTRDEESTPKREFRNVAI
jgi:hypothetical protein